MPNQAAKKIKEFFYLWSKTNICPWERFQIFSPFSKASRSIYGYLPLSSDPSGVEEEMSARLERA